MEGRLLFLLSVLVLGRAAVLNECNIIKSLQDKLLYEHRVLYMAEYFPINYKLHVKYEEVLRCHNITSLISKGVTVEELRYLWGIVNQSFLKTACNVLPQRHPTRSFIVDLQTIFATLMRDKDELDVKSAAVLQILEKLNKSEKVKAVTPKSLLDNCTRVLYALYEEECQLQLASRVRPRRCMTCRSRQHQEGPGPACR